MPFDRDTEIREAVSAGYKALQSLREAQEYLDSAGRWGLWDILGGGSIVGFVKHTKLQKARICMENARQDLRNFRRELDDVDEYFPDIEIGSFLTFADLFFDDLISDIFVHSKIQKARAQVAEAIARVSGIVNSLKSGLSSGGNF